MLPRAASLLAVCAHPDDESFGLGATLHAFALRGARVHMLCFTHGEASTLGPGPAPSLHRVRAGELSAAAEVLGLEDVDLRGYRDGALDRTPLHLLVSDVERSTAAAGADMLLVFDEGGITGHPDHRRATQAALAARGELPVLAWAVPAPVAQALNDEFGTAFVGRRDEEIDLRIEVDRGCQRDAIACHATQATGNPVLWRRLELSGDHEVFRWLRAPSVRTVPVGSEARID